MHKFSSVGNLNYRIKLKATWKYSFQMAKTISICKACFALLNLIFGNLSYAFYNMRNAINELLIKEIFERTFAVFCLCPTHRLKTSRHSYAQLVIFQI